MKSDIFIGTLAECESKLDEYKEKCIVIKYFFKIININESKWKIVITYKKRGGFATKCLRLFFVR